jgi:hypothetical protein
MFIKATVPIVVSHYGEVQAGRIVAVSDGKARSLIEAGAAVLEDIEELARKMAADLDAHPPPVFKGEGFGQAVAKAIKERLASRSRKQARHSSFSAGQRFADRFIAARKAAA